MASAPSEEALGGAASATVDSLTMCAGEGVADGRRLLEAASPRPRDGEGDGCDGEGSGDRAVAAAAGGGELELSGTAALVGPFATCVSGKRDRRAISLRHCAAFNSGAGCGAPGAAELTARSLDVDGAAVRSLRARVGRP